MLSDACNFRARASIEIVRRERDWFYPVMVGSLAFFCRYEISFWRTRGKQICHHFPSYGKYGPVASFFVFFSLIDHSQLVTLSRRQPRSFHP